MQCFDISNVLCHAVNTIFNLVFFLENTFKVFKKVLYLKYYLKVILIHFSYNFFYNIMYKYQY